MSEGKRPGGLTALAILNIIFSVFGFLTAFGLLALITLSQKTERGEEIQTTMQESLQQAFKGDIDPTLIMPILWTSLGLALVSALLLFLSGIGYLKLKKFLGRGLGNAYALLSLLSLGISLIYLPFGLGDVVELIYPVLTLILINTTFKEDFVN